MNRPPDDFLPKIVIIKDLPPLLNEIKESEDILFALFSNREDIRVEYKLFEELDSLLESNQSCNFIKFHESCFIFNNIITSSESLLGFRTLVKTMINPEQYKVLNSQAAYSKRILEPLGLTLKNVFSTAIRLPLPWVSERKRQRPTKHRK